MFIDIAVIAGRLAFVQCKKCWKKCQVTQISLNLLGMQTWATWKMWHFTRTECIQYTALQLCTWETELTVGLSRIPGLARGSS